MSAPPVSVRTAFLDAVRESLPDLRLLTDEIDRDSYRRDETAYLEPPLPIAVALPTETAQVAELVRLAAAHRVPVVPRGAGTGLSGGAASVEGGLTIALTRMDRVLEIDRANMVVVTQPGVVNANLKQAVAAEGLFYAPDPASYETCTIGGNLGTNAGGLCCVKYGVTRDSVVGLEIVTASGEIIRLGGRTTKDVAGYGLIPLIVGSQGTLAIVTEAILRLRPAPPPKATLIAFFPSLDSAGRAVAGLTDAAVEPCTLELMDRTTIRAVDDVHNLGLDRDAAAMLLIESDLPGVAAGLALETAARACDEAGATSSLIAADPQEADWLRQARRMAFHAMEGLGVARMEDVGVPRGRVPELLAAIERVAAEQGLVIATFGHVGDGNLHPNIILDRDDPEGEAKLLRATDALYRAAISMGGTVTAEHGIGLARRDYLELQRGAGAVAMMRAIKTALDPLGILNPGKVLPEV
ncbi:MAG: FAD-binding protein [Chloroflexota bacterium]|nr:FAD-binding protein [Chloroflexota bacterium]